MSLIYVGCLNRLSRAKYADIHVHVSPKEGMRRNGVQGLTAVVNVQVLLDFSLTVKAAPHACVITM